MHRQWLSAISIGALASLVAAGSQAAVLQNFTPQDGQTLVSAMAGAPTGAQLIVARTPLPIILVPQGFVGAAAATVTAVPEPAGWAMMLVGFGGLGVILRRRRADLRAV